MAGVRRAQLELPSLPLLTRQPTANVEQPGHGVRAIGQVQPAHARRRCADPPGGCLDGGGARRRGTTRCHRGAASVATRNGMDDGGCAQAVRQRSARHPRVVTGSPKEERTLNAHNQPLVTVFSLGGTIASTNTPGANGGGVTPQLDAKELLASVPGLGEAAALEAVAFRQTASGDLTFDDLTVLAAEISVRFETGVAGVVVVQGTDTIEETS